MTATTSTTAHGGQRSMPAAVIVRPRQDGARSRPDALQGGRRPPTQARGAKSLQAARKTPRRSPSRSVPVPPLEKCLTGGGQWCRIPIAGGGHALIDREDFALVSQYRWHMGGTKSRYPVSKSKPGDGRTPTYLHRLVMDARAGELVDHRDGNRLDARKGNLRKATRSQNAANRGFTKSSSGYFGVHCYSHNRRKPYRASLRRGSTVWRGKYRATAIEAARDYDALAREAWGAFASLNFPAPGERRCKPVGAALEARRKQAPQCRKAVAHA